MYQVILDGCIPDIGDPGTLFAWGENTCGQLGQNDTVAYSLPVQIPGSTWNDISVAASGGFSLARKSDGTLWSWGYNGFGSLGDFTTVTKSSPVQIPGTIWNDISVGYLFSLARKTDGTLWAWGLDSSGSLGNLSVPQRASSPIQIPGTTWNDVAAGGSGQGLALARKTDGTLWAWGYNGYGELGDGTVAPKSSPVQVPGTTWNDISVGQNISFARRTDGTLWAWGRNTSGQLGDNTIASKSSPVQVPGTTWNDISASSICGYVLARKTDGTLWAWGTNANGQLGDNTIVNKSTPVQIPGTTWNDISGSGSHALARKTDGTLWAWGLNASGQLGDNTTVSKSSPIQIPGTTWNDISSGSNSTLARKTL